MSWTIESSSTVLPFDLVRELELIHNLPKHRLPTVRTLFDVKKPITIGRAPGRLDLMGGIADYSGSLVLQLPIQEATFATAQQISERSLTIFSLDDTNNGRRSDDDSLFHMALSDFEENGAPISYEAAQNYFQKNPGTAWAAYVAGTLLVLMREEKVTFDEGMNILIHSAVPEGKGVSSSAALEVATMKAIAAACNLEIEPRRMGILCQMVENLVVGAPCGVMDQMSACCGEENRLLALLCQPAEILPSVELPAELAVWGIDSGIRHAVSGADYGSVRVGTFMGYRIMLDMACIADKSVPPKSVHDTLWQGYLANVSPSEFEQFYAHSLPLTMKGADFLAQYAGTTDSVTHIDPTRIYAIRYPTAHPIYEHFRVKAFAHLLHGNALVNGPLLGECMYQSHASYSSCGLGSSGTDELVALARKLGPEQGIFGAKITGGGSGGTVAVLGRADAHDAIDQIVERYDTPSGHSPYVFVGSSAGAADFCATPAMEA